MLSLLARGMGRCGAVAVCLQVAGCSLQNFDALSGGDGAGSGGSSGGLPSVGGRGGDGGEAPIAGRGGSGPTAGSGGQVGTGGSRAGGGGAAGVGNPGGGGTSDGGSAGSSGGPLSGSDGGTALNLLPDPSFTLGHVGWKQFGAAGLGLEDAPGEGRDGSQCLLVTNRTQTYAGPAIDLTTLVVGGQVYTAEAWVRTGATTTQSVTISIKSTCTGAADVYTQLVTQLVASGEWLFLSGEFTAETCALDEYTLYIEGPEIGVDLYVDDVGLYRVQ